MSVGTKVSLVVGVLFAAVLAFYYGVGSPVKNELNSASKDKASESLKQVAAIEKPRAQAPTRNRQTQRPSIQDSTTQRRGLLSESVKRALGTGKPLEKTKKTPTAELRKGGTARKTIQNNLAKDSGLEMNPVKVEPKAIDPLARNNAEKPRSGLTGKPRTTPYSVKENDSMWTIAKEWFGDGSKWNLIAKANPYVDPDRLDLGQVLQLPPKGAGPRPKPVPIVRDTQNTYRVKHGDSLSSIAGKYYGDETKWRIIYEANRSVIGNDPGALVLGARLRIPPKSS